MTRADFDAVLAPLAPPGGPGAAVAVRIGGEIVHAAGYGLANLEWGLPIDPDTVFRIGSITKQFTGAAILRLAERGKLGLDDRIERHLPEYPMNGRTITVRQLLNHTSGIKNVTELPLFAEFQRKDHTLKQAIALFQDLPPDFEPGEKWRYSNSGYILLGAIIETVAGQDYATFLQEEFFGPLGMTRTSYLLDAPIVTKRASGYEPTRSGPVNTSPISMTLPHAAGALGSTVGDLLTWDAALHGGRVLSAESYAAMITPGKLNDGSPTTYGLGLSRGAYRGIDAIGHNGGINGFVSTLEYWPGSDLSVAILANITSFPTASARLALVRRALGLEDVVREIVKASEAELAACEGLYTFEAGPLRLKAKDGALAAAYPRPGSIYRPMGPGAYFLADDPEVTIAFAGAGEAGYEEARITAYDGEPARGVRAPEPQSEGSAG